MLARLVARSKSRPDVSPGRALFVAAFIGFWMLLVCARLVYLQFSQYEALANRARQQQQNEIETGPRRGELLDRQERQLARSVQTVSLFLDPDGLDTATLDRNAQQLAKSLGLKQTELTKEFRDAAAAKKRFIWIARRLDAEVANKIPRIKTPGPPTQPAPKRYYPKRAPAARRPRNQVRRTEPACPANTTRAEALLPERFARCARTRIRRTRRQGSRRCRTVLQREDLR